MRQVRLQTKDGSFVQNVVVESEAKNPGVLVWNNRYFDFYGVSSSGYDGKGGSLHTVVYYRETVPAEVSGVDTVVCSCEQCSKEMLA